MLFGRLQALVESVKGSVLEETIVGSSNCCAVTYCHIGAVNNAVSAIVYGQWLSSDV